MSQLLSKFLTILAVDPVVQQAISDNSSNPNELSTYLKSGGATSTEQQKFQPLSNEETAIVIAAQGKPVGTAEYETLVAHIKDGFCGSWSVHLVSIDGRTFTLNETIDPPASSIRAAQIVVNVENVEQ